MPKNLDQVTTLTHDSARPPLGRRVLIASASLASVGVVGALSRPSLAAEEPTFYVFLHTQSSAHSLERLLRRVLPGVAVTVLSRSKDFQSHLRQRPDAVLSLLPVLKAHDFAAHLQGVRGSATSEPYVLLSTSKVAPSTVRRVGAVDLLGRARMPEFVGKLLGGNTPAVTPVIKVMDLLPLLQFNKVEAVVLPERNVEWFKDHTRASLLVTALPSAMVGLPAISFLTPRGQRIGDLIDGIGSSIRREIGVDSWR